MTAEDAAKLREGLRSDMEKAEHTEKALEQQMNDLDTALTHLKRLSLRSCSLSDDCSSCDKKNVATSVATPETPQPQLSMPTDWSRLMTGWCNTHKPTQSVLRTAKEIDVFESLDQRVLPLTRNDSAVQENAKPFEMKECVLNCEREMLHHLSGLEVVLHRLKLQPDEQAQLARNTFDRLWDVRELIEDLLAHHPSYPGSESFLTRHPSSTGDDAFCSQSDCSLTSQSASDYEETDSLSCSKQRSGCALVSKYADGKQPLGQTISDQLLNLSSDMETAEQSQDALLKELSNVDAALTRLKCMSQSSQSLNVSQFARTFLSMCGRGGLEPVKEVECLQEEEGENDGDEVCGEVSHSCLKIAQSLPIGKSHKSSCGGSTLPAELLLFQANDCSLTSTATAHSPGKSELSPSIEIDCPAGPETSTVSLEGKKRFSRNMEDLNLDIEHAQESQDLLVAELENLDSALTRLKITGHRFGSVRWKKSSLAQDNRGQSCSTEFAKDTITGDVVNDTGGDKCLGRLMSLPISSNYYSSKSDLPVDLLLANFPSS